MGSPEVGFTNDNMPTQPGSSIVAPPSQVRPPNAPRQAEQPQQQGKVIVIPPRQPTQQLYTPPSPPATITP
jgi:hypothetical protein